MNLCYGNAILSRFPSRRRRRSCSASEGWGRRDSCSPRSRWGAACVPLVNLHLHFSSRRKRLQQLDMLVTWLRLKQRERGRAWAVSPIVCGDFNTPNTKDDATASLLSHLCDYGDYVCTRCWAPHSLPPLPRRALDFVFMPARLQGGREPGGAVVPFRPPARPGGVFSGVTGRIAFDRPSYGTDPRRILQGGSRTGRHSLPTSARAILTLRPRWLRAAPSWAAGRTSWSSGSRSPIRLPTG